MPDTASYVGQPGEHISKAAKRAIEMAQLHKADVVLVFNDIRIIVGYSSDPDAIVNRFNELCEERRKAWEASPEGVAYDKAREADRAKQAAMEADGAVHVEDEMQKASPPRIKTPEELATYVQSLIHGKHDYGTCVYAMSLAAQAAFNYVASQLGVTGFQASCADLNFISKTRRIEGPFMLLKAQDMLYPQYNLHNMLSTAMDEWREWCAEEAKKKLAEAGEGSIHPNVEVHWRTLAAYIAPKKEE